MSLLFLKWFSKILTTKLRITWVPTFYHARSVIKILSLGQDSNVNICNRNFNDNMEQYLIKSTLCSNIKVAIVENAYCAFNVQQKPFQKCPNLHFNISKSGIWTTMGYKVLFSNTILKLWLQQKKKEKKKKKRKFKKFYPNLSRILQLSTKSNSDGSNTILSNIERTRTSFFEHRTDTNVFIIW